MAKTTKVLLDDKARAAVQRGVSAIYEPVRRTLGPAGRNALLYRTFNRGSRITNDGVTVSEVIEPKDEFEALAATTFKESAKLTNQKAGDGTTTTIVIGGRLFADVATKRKETGTTIRTRTAGGTTNVMQIRKEILNAAEAVKEEIKKSAKHVKTLAELEKIATVSVEDPELGKIIAKMAWEVGTDGYIDTVEGYKGEIETELIKGMRFPAKIGAKAFMNNPARYEMVAEDCPVVVTNIAITNAAQISEFTQHLTTSKMVIFAPSFSDEVLVALVQSAKQSFFVFPVATPSLRTEQYEDLAIYCDAMFINKDAGGRLEQIRNQHLGFLEKLVVKETEAKEDAVATGGKGAIEKEGKSAIGKRIETLRGQLVEMKQDQFKKVIERRIANMASAVGVIKVGASSQAESLYKKLKIEDAVYACKAALRGGYVKGGGLCLKEIAEKLPESILTAALKAPYEQIQENAGGGLEISKDVIDPAEAVFYAVEHATSVVSHLATVDILIPEAVEPGPGEGYESIAKAIGMYVSFWARKEGLIKGSEAEVAAEQLALMEEKIANDRG